MPNETTSDKVQHRSPRDAAAKEHAPEHVPWKCLPCTWTWQAKAKARANAKPTPSPRQAHAHA